MSERQIVYKIRNMDFGQWYDISKNIDEKRVITFFVKHWIDTDFYAKEGFELIFSNDYKKIKKLEL